MQNKYYKNFQIITHAPFWRPYICWVYNKGIADVKKLKIKPDFTKQNFTCLLCGVSGEVTGDEFIKFVLQKNSKAKIIIIDYADEQITAISRLVNKKYSIYDITVQKMNALDLTKHFNQMSFDWIETDGFLEYFDHENLNKLLQEWKKILKKNGFITIRDFASKGVLGRIIDKARIWIGKNYLGVKLNKYTQDELEKIFVENKLQFISGLTPFLTYRRYAMISK